VCAFKNCSALSSIILAGTPEEIADHVFYGCDNATIYCVATSTDQWSDVWNSSYRPLFLGCTLSDDGTYVTQFIYSVDNMENVNESNEINVPEREQYDFSIFEDIQSEAQYALDDILTIPDGTTVRFVWENKN
jgi:hypothetical protein